MALRLKTANMGCFTGNRPFSLTLAISANLSRKIPCESCVVIEITSTVDYEKVFSGSLSYTGKDCKCGRAYGSWSSSDVYQIDWNAVLECYRESECTDGGQAPITLSVALAPINTDGVTTGIRLTISSTYQVGISPCESSWSILGLRGDIDCPCSPGSGTSLVIDLPVAGGSFSANVDCVCEYDLECPDQFDNHYEITGAFAWA